MIEVEFKGEKKYIGRRTNFIICFMPNEDDFESYLNKEITFVVITVPAYFSNISQRQATKDAGIHSWII